MESTQFLEIEHKFIIPETWDFQAFERRLKELGYQNSSEVQVADTYYVTAACPGYIYRHRYDKELQHLTVKSLMDDPEVRLEVNLDLGHHKGSQKVAVEAFLSPMGIMWSGTLTKQVKAYYFPDCEVVHYHAKFRDKSVTCVEIEAKEPPTILQGKQILQRYASALNLESIYRSNKTLFELLLEAHLPKELINKFRR